MNLDIRTGTLEDLNILVAIENLCFVHNRLSRTNFRYYLTRANYTTLLADRDGTVCGYGLLLRRKNSNTAYLQSIAVVPALQGMGVGLRLMNSVEYTAFKLGCTAIKLHVSESNVPASTLYAANGYKRTRKLAFYYADGSSAWEMVKELI